MSRLSLIKAVLMVLPLLFVISLPFTTQNSFAVLECADDPDGANDRPGQRDLTQACNGLGSDEGDIAGGFNPSNGNPPLVCNASDDLITWNWDDTDWSGANTGDVCLLYDTNDNGLADISYCVTVDQDPAQFFNQRIFTCDDSRADRCSSDSEDPGGGLCTVDITNDDPFPAGEDFPNDTKGACCIDIAGGDLGDTNAVLTLICSYPSEQPNSAPADCISNPSLECEVDMDCPGFGEDECIIVTCESNSCVSSSSDDPICNPPIPTPTPAPEGPIVIVPTMGQWGMLLSAVVLGIFAIIRLRSVKDSELS